MTTKSAAKADQKTIIYSMASNDVVVPRYAKKAAGSIHEANRIEKAIIIAGGANVRDPLTMRQRKCVETEVSAEDLEILKANPAFMRKVERGFISIGEKPASLKSDKSAQITEEQMKAKSPEAKVSTGEAEV